MTINCNVCQTRLGNPIYSSVGQVSITSLCELTSQSTKVFFCSNCTHIYTPPLPDVDEYYASEYNILIESEEEDQIVSFPDGRREYRFDLQVNTFVKKINPPHAAKILDYGCAKSTTLKRICEQRSDIEFVQSG